MTFDRSFRTLTYLTVAWAFLTLALFAYLHVPAIIMFVAGFAICVLKRRLNLRISNGVWLAMSVTALVLSIYGWFAMGEHLYSVVYLFLYLEINKLWTMEKTRDVLQVYGLTFFQVLAAAVSTSSIVFGPALLGYMMLIFAALITVTIRSDAERAYASIPPKNSNPNAVAMVDRKRSMAVLNESAYFSAGLSRWMGAMVAIIVVIGAGLFFVIPRLQAQYFLEGLSPSRNTRMISGFSDMVNFTGADEIQTDASIVMRAIPKRNYASVNGIPTGMLRLRGTALDEYDGRHWQKSETASASSLRRSSIEVNVANSTHDSSRGYYETEIVLEPNRRMYLFGPDRPYQFDFGNQRLPITLDDELGSVQLRLSQWMTNLRYTVKSDSLIEPKPPMTGGATKRPEAFRKVIQEFTGTPSVSSRYLQLPPHPDVETARRLATEWTKGLTSQEEMARVIERQLQTQYQYSLSVPFASRDDHLTRFLTVERRGHCEYFATAMAIMLRTLNIPSRIVNGYVTDEWTGGADGYFVVRQQHAHSWVEVFLNDKGWITYDPTPSSGIASNRIKQTWYHSLTRWVDSVKLFWYETVIDFDATDQNDFYRSMFRGFRKLPSLDDVLDIGGIVEKTGRSPARLAMVGIVFMVAVLLVIFIVREVWRMRVEARQARLIGGAPGSAARMIPDYMELLREMEIAYVRTPAQTPLEYANSVVHQDGEAAEFLPITRAYYKARFANAGWSERDGERARAFLKKMRQERGLSPAGDSAETTGHDD